MKNLLSNMRKSKIAKKALAFVLTFSVLLSTFAGLSILGQPWDGAVATSYESGSGTANDPYMIADASQLLLVVTSTDTAGKYYKLANDIHINDTTTQNWYQLSGLNAWAPVMNIATDADKAFKGNFNGDGFKVYGLYINNQTSAAAADMLSAAGLFPLVGEGAVITAVGLEKAYISSTCAADPANSGNLTGAVGGLVGAVTGATTANPVKISQSYAGEGVSLAGGYIGGIVGLTKGTGAKSVVLENCYSQANGTANRSGNTPAGLVASFGQYNRVGLIGVEASNSSEPVYVTGCYTSNGNISCTGTKADENKSNYCTQWDSGAGHKISADLMIGEGAKTNMPLLDFDNVYKTTERYPALRIFDREFATEKVPYDVWDGTTEKPTKGTGAATDPFLIENAEQFAWAFQNQPTVGSGESNWPAYKLMTDIYLNNLGAVNWATGAVRPGYTVNEWTPGNVYIQFDGNGNMVYGLYVNTEPATYAETGAPAGLIGTNKNNQWITFKNLGVDKAYMNTDGNAGVFVGKMMGGSAQATIDSCYVGPDVTINGYFVASFIGYGPAKMTIKNSVNLTDKMTSYKYAEAYRKDYSGLLGSGVWGGNKKVENSYSVTKLHANGDRTNNQTSFTMSNSYCGQGYFDFDKVVALGNMQGFDALTNAEKMPNLGSAFKATETFPVPAVLYEAITGIWNGTVASNSNIMGTGTETDPFIIDRPSKAAKMVLNSANETGKNWYSGYYKITKDLYLNDVTAINWSNGEVVKEGYVPNVWVSSIATDGGASKVYGDNHVIRGLYVNDTATDKKHAFWTYSYSGVKMYDLGFDNAYVKAKGPAGIIFSNNKTAGTKSFVFENVYVGENATVISTENSAGAFYAWGVAANMTFKNCYSVASVTGVGKVGSFAPDVWGNTAMTFENCYGLGAYRLNNNSSATYTNCYSDSASATGLTQVSKANMQGLDALIAVEKMPNLGSAFTATEGYPVLSSFPVEKKDDEEEEPDSKFWDGSYTKPDEGTGAENDPYIIDTPAELAWSMNNAASNVGRNKFYKLNADIYLNDPEKINWETGEIAAGYSVKQWNARYFSGTFDGNYHIIYGLYADKNPASYVQSEANGLGLVSENEWNNGATFKNLGLDCIYFDGPSSVGALAGNVKTGDNGKITADRVFVGSRVTLKGQSVGGLIGYGAGALAISNCYSHVTAMTDTANKKAGIIGNVWNGTNKSITNSYALDRIYGNNQPNVFTDNFCQLDNVGATVLAAAEMKGLTVLSAGGKMETLGDAFQGTISYPMLRGFNNTIPDDGSAYWDGKVARPAGDGSFTNPYKITNGSELAWAVKGNANGSYFKIMNDIYLNDIEAIDWATGTVTKEGYTLRKWESGTFGGSIDGNGKVIYGMYINDNSTTGAWRHDGRALINNITGATIIDRLGIDKSFVQNKNGAAAFVGSVNKDSSVSFGECYVGENVWLKGYLVGGFVSVSQNFISVNACYNAMPLANYALFDAGQAEQPKKGGILGDCWAANTVMNSWSFETIRTNNATLTTVYSAVEDPRGAYTPISIDNMKGLDALSNPSKMKGLANCGSFFATEGYPVLKCFVEGFEPDRPEGDIWSGRVATTFTGGKGTQAEPYLISNGAELALAISKGGLSGSYFKLTKDIYLNDVTEKFWAQNSDNKAWVSGVPGFNGHLDGAGFIVYGLWFPVDNADDNAGLIPQFDQGSVKNLGVRYAQVCAKTSAGALVGRSGSTKKVKLIEQCFADDTCDVRFTDRTKYGGAAGIVGYAQPEKTTEPMLQIVNCYSKAMLFAANQSSDRANGLIGTAWWSSYSIKSSYSYGYPAYSGVNANTAPWCLYQDGEEAVMDINTLISKVYCDTRAPQSLEAFVQITPREDMTDTAAKKTLKGFDFNGVWQTVSETSPKLKLFTSITGEETDLSKDGEIFASGKGTKKSPYIIMNEAQLRYLIESENTANKYYKLGADIYINDTTKKNWKVNNPSVWYESGTDGNFVFQGHFNGDGHTVYGLYVNNTPDKYEEVQNFTSKYTGLFPTVSTTATVMNVHVRNSYISGTGYSGSIVGFVRGGGSGYATVMGCSADETVTIKAQTAGGLVGGGFRGLKLYYSYFIGTLDATAAYLGRQGALVGDIWSTDQEAVECYSLGYANYRPGYSPSLIMYTYSDTSGADSTILTKEQMTGENAKQNMELTWGDVWYTAKGKTPQLKVIPTDFKHKFNDEGEKGRVWSGKLATKFAGGSGTEDDPYIIETPEQLALLVTEGANKTLGKHYKLGCDIKVNDTSYVGWQNEARNWIVGSKEFGGHLDGDGHVVSGLYFSGSATYVALFSRVTGGAFIEKVGIVNSHLSSIVSESATQTYVAPFAASYGNWVNEEQGYFEPRFSQCFADDTVYLEGGFVGGIFCGTGRAVHIDNCYFTGEITATDHHGTLIGNTWGSTYYKTITNSYDSSLDRNVASSNGGKAYFTCENYYHDGPLNGVDGKSLGLLWMKGEAAKEHMLGFDFENIWKIVPGGTPVLRCFKNAEQYSCTREPAKVKIEFVTGEGSKLEPIEGFPMFDKIPELPVPELYGYDFGGWYYFEECDIPFDLEKFPQYDCYIYAKWIQRGFNQGFEGEINEVYDIGAGTQLFKPGVSGYNPRFLHGGLRSVHALGDGENNGLFLLSYDNMLTVGRKYDIYFWVATDTDGASGKVELLHANHGQVDSDVVGYETAFEFTGLQVGKWTQFKYTFTANAPFILVRTPADVSLYIDDIQVVDLKEDGELGKLDGFNPEGVSGEPDKQTDMTLIWIIVGVAGGVVLLGGIATTVIVVAKKSAKKKKNNA